MTVSQKLIENVKELKKALNEISVYDLDVYTSMELYYEIANKLNEVIKELMRFEGVVSDEVIKQNETLIYLTGEGLNEEVVKKIDQMVKEGTFESIINHDIFNSLNLKIEEIRKDSQKLIRKNTTFCSNNTPVITFIDDDNNSAFLTLIKPIFDKYNIKGSLAVVTDTVGKEGYLTEKQLMDLQNQGYTIMSHSKSHDASVFKGSVVDLGTVNSTKILNEYRDSYNWLVTRGFKGADTIVYPWGNFGDHSKKYKDLARNFYNNGVNASGGLISNSPNDNMYLSRQFVQSTINLDTYKNLIDECVKNKGWLILGTHSNTNEIVSSHFETVVRYAVNSGASILPFIEANEVKGNALSIGEYENENSIYVSKNGNVKAIDLQNCKVYSYHQTKELSMDVLPSEFDKGIHSLCIRNSNDPLTEQGGNLILHNNGGDFVYETFVPFGKTDMYIRKFDYRSDPQVWGEWKLINGVPKEYIASSLNQNYVTSTVHIKKDINTVTGTIRLVCDSKTGTFTHGSEMAKIVGLHIPYYCITPCIITTGDGEVVNGALETFYLNGNTVFRCHGSVNKNNIRWIDWNFTFNVYR